MHPSYFETKGLILLCELCITSIVRIILLRIDSNSPLHALGDDLCPAGVLFKDGVVDIVAILSGVPLRTEKSDNGGERPWLTPAQSTALRRS